MDRTNMYVLAADGPSNLFNGVKPGWGPFAEVGSTAKRLISVLMAVALFACVAYTIWGASQQRAGAATHDSHAAEKGKAMFVSGLVGCAVLGSARRPGRAGPGAPARAGHLDPRRSWPPSSRRRRATGSAPPTA